MYAKMHDLGRLTKQKFWNFEKCINFLCYMDQYKDMHENKFYSNIAPSAGTGPHPFTMHYGEVENGVKSGQL